MLYRFAPQVVTFLSMLGMGSVLRHHIGPAETWSGNPARHIGTNQVGLERASLTLEKCRELFTAAHQRRTMESRL